MRLMNRGIVTLVWILLSISVANAETITNTSYVLPTGERVLQQQAIVSAPLADIWRAFTTSEGLRSFMAPVALIDFRAGGIWEASYDPNAKIGDPGNIRNEVLAYVPMKMIVVRVVRTPPSFPHPDVAKSVWTVLEFEDLGFNRVRVSSSMVGWRSGPEWDQIYNFFERGNAQVLSELQKRFVEGPKKWLAPQTK